MALVTDQALIAAAIQAEVRRRVNAAIEAEIEATSKRIANAIRAEADKIALSLISTYDLYIDRNRIVIEVKKIDDLPTPPATLGNGVDIL
jgi:hypothetical protein